MKGLENEKVFGVKLEGIQYRERIGVYGIVLNEEGYIAVIRTPRGYFLPGGGIEANENHEQCIKREFKEEIGYDINVKRFIGKASAYRYAEGLKDYYHMTGFYYIVELMDKIAEPIEEDHELLWMKPKETSEALYLEHQAWAIEEILE